MDWVLQEHACAEAYINDVIIGTTGDTQEEVMWNHDQDSRWALETLQQEMVGVHMKKPQPFINGVQFGGHIPWGGKNLSGQVESHKGLKAAQNGHCLARF